MFSLQEYQHVHLLWFKKRSFTLVWKPNPPLCSVRWVHLRARVDAVSESTMGALLLLYAPLLRCLCSRVRCEMGVNQAPLNRSRWKRLSSRDQWNLSPATMCCFGAAADHALAQVRPRQIFTRTLSKNGRSLEPCLTFEASLLDFWDLNWSLKRVFTFFSGIVILLKFCLWKSLMKCCWQYKLFLTSFLVRKWQLRIFFVNPNPDFLFFVQHEYTGVIVQVLKGLNKLYKGKC